MSSEVHEKDLGKGIDARNSENQINPGFWETLVNAETDGNIVKKRRGYQQLGGYLPFRVQSITYDTSQLCFNLDSYVDLSRLRSSPITVRGTTYSTDAHDDFPDSTFSEQHYTGFNVSVRQTGVDGVDVNNPTNSFTIAQPAHGHSSWIQHSSIYESTSESNLSNELVFPDKHEITASAPLITTTGLTQTDIQTNQSLALNPNLSYIHASVDASVIGTQHYYPTSLSNPSFTSPVDNVTPLVMTIPDISLTSLQSTNLIVSVYRKVDADTVEKIIPDDITLSGVTLSITIAAVGVDFAAQEYFYVVTAVPDANVVAGQVLPGSQEVVISGITPFTSFSVYTVSGGIREYVIPDTAIYDDTTEQLTISFNTNEAVNYQIYYTAESLRVNQLCVDTTTGTPSSTSNVELDLYGLDPLDVIVQENRNHWLTHIDTYRSEGSSQLLTGVAGNEYVLSTPNPDPKNIIVPTLYPRYEQILETAQYIIPYFQNTGTTFTAVAGRGYVTLTNGFAGPEITTVAYQGSTESVGTGSTTVFTVSNSVFPYVGQEVQAYTGASLSTTTKIISRDLAAGTVTVEDDITGVTRLVPTSVRFTLKATALSLNNITVGSDASEYVQNLNALATPEGTYTSVLENDLLTVENTGYSIMNGSHVIQSITLDTNTDLIYVDCTVTGVTNSDFDETFVGGYAQIYTSPLEINAAVQLENTILPGATITVGGNTYTVRGNTITDASGDNIEKLLISDVTVNVELSSGLFILGSATTDVIPMRDTTDPTVENYVKGDMIKYTDVDRWFRIKDIVQVANQTVTLAGNQLEFDTAIATNFEAGQKLAIITEGLEGGVHTISSVVNTTTLEMNTTFVATTARLIGKTFEIDEEFGVADTVNNTLSFSPTARWNSIQKPSVPSNFDAEDKIAQYPFNAFATTQQRIIRSTMVSNNMYLTNGEDAILKYDGSTLSRAGLFRWEGALFVRKVASTGGAIVSNSTSIPGTGDIDKKVFEATLGELVSVFTPGQQLKTNGGQLVTVTSVDVSERLVTVAEAFDAAVTSLSETGLIKYYFRLNVIDANNNIIGSAASGVDNNYTIEMPDRPNGVTVGIKLAKPPKLPLMDYNRLEYEIYRTKQDGAVFFKVATVQITNDNTDDFVYFEDKAQDTELTESDPVSTSTVGAEIATAIDEPLRARYVTSANNRLVLGNLKDSPRVDVQIFRPSVETNLNDLTFTFTNDSGSIDYKFTSTGGTAVTAISASGNLTGGGPLTAGNWCYLYKDTADSDGSPEYLGWFKAIDTNQIDYNGAAYPTISNVKLIEGSSTSIPIYTGAEFSDDDSAYQSGSNQLMIPAKLINAINSTQFKLADFSLSGEGRTDSAELGRFNIKSLTNTPFKLTMTHGSFFTNASVFVNNSKVISGTVSKSTETSYASRMLVSFQNFGEVFDRPRAIIPEDSLSVIDVNSADGQEITGIIPFFGESTSQDSRKQDIVICFKENSIYAVNVSTRTITKIDSRGVGCNAPHSIAAVPNGIIFAARSGVYRLNRSFDVIWVGRFLDRVWQENTNLDQLALATGHVFPQEKQYRLSVAVGSSETASEVYNYEYGDESAGQIGAWTKFTNIPSTGWASDGVESYFGSTLGKMFTIRNTSTDADYRDDDSGISFSGTYRGMDFGSPGRRKIVRAIVSHFRVLKTDSATTMEIGVDLIDEFTPTSSFTLQDSVEDGLSTIIGSKVKSIRQNIPLQRGVYFQVKYANSEKDTPLALAGITFRVAGLDYQGITSAQDTFND